SVTGQQYPLGELRGSDFVRCGRGSNVSGYGFIDDSAGMCLGAPKGAVFLGSNGFPLKDSQFWPIADPTPKWTGSAQTSFRYRKLREIAIAYTLDQPWVRNTFGFDAIDVRVSGRNLKIWTNYTGIDPETSLFGADVAQQGFDYFSTPQTRSFTFSITLHH